jgi:hypothetical protein
MITNVILILLSLILAFMTKGSFYSADDGTPISEYSVFLSYPISIDKDFILDELKKVDLIAKVRFTGERNPSYISVKSIVIIEDVYKGDTNLVGEYITIIEQNYFNHDSKMYIPFSFFNLMRENEQYFVFLIKKDYMVAYQNKLQFYEFFPYPYEFSVFPVNNVRREYINPLNDILYKDIYEYDFLFFSDEEYDEVLNVQREIIRRFIDDIS